MMRNLVTKKLMYKYNLISFSERSTLEVGSLITIGLSKVKFRSSFLGVIIKKKRCGLSYVVTLRNVLKKYAIEKSFNLYCPSITYIYLMKNKLRKFSNRQNLFYLRKMSRMHSTYDVLK